MYRPKPTTVVTLATSSDITLTLTIRPTEGLTTMKRSDGILTQVLKECNFELAPIFCEVINVCVAKGTIPKLWKLSAISPVPKKQIQLAITTIGQQLLHL